MRVNELSKTKLQSVACPDCRAPRKHPCRAEDGRPTGIHWRRQHRFLTQTSLGRSLLSAEEEVALGIRKKTPIEVEAGRELVRSVRCPECQAAPGERCISIRTARPRPAQSHAARSTAFAREAARLNGRSREDLEGRE